MSNPLATFVVGPVDKPICVEFEVRWVDGSPNIVTKHPIPLPPLNINGLRRLAKTLIAFSDLLQYGEGFRAPQDEP